eukprot:9474850-Pyramimonas_sp.AAC.1
MTGEAGMARSQLQGVIPKGVRSSSEWAIEMFKYNTAMQGIPREIGSDSAALRTVLAFVASLSAGRLFLTVGYVPTKNGTLQMTTASRLSPKDLPRLPPVTYADSCTLAHYGNDVNPGFHYYEAEGFGQDMSRFEELADTPTLDGTAREASEAEPSHDDGRPSTIHEEAEADPESHVMEVRFA